MCPSAQEMHPSSAWSTLISQQMDPVYLGNWLCLQWIQPQHQMNRTRSMLRFAPLSPSGSAPVSSGMCPSSISEMPLCRWSHYTTILLLSASDKVCPDLSQIYPLSQKMCPSSQECTLCMHWFDFTLSLHSLKKIPSNLISWPLVSFFYSLPD